MTQLKKIKDIWGDEHYASAEDLADKSLDPVPMRTIRGDIKRFRHRHLLQDVRIKREHIAKIG